MDVPEHVKYWREIFSAIADKKKCKVRSKSDLGFFTQLLEYCLKEKDNGTFVLNKNWDMAYHLSMRMEFIRATGDGEGRFQGSIQMYSVESGIRFKSEGNKTKVYFLPEDIDVSTKVIQYLRNASAYMKAWDKDKQMFSVFLEDNELVDILEKEYVGFIVPAETITRQKAKFT